MNVIFRKVFGFLLTALVFVMTNPIQINYAKAAAAIRAGDDRAPIEGTVLEKIDASNYTYLRLKTESKDKAEVWVAVPQIDIKINSKAVLQKPIPMFGYESATLKRKFDRLYFGVLSEQAKDIAESSSRGHWLPGTSKKDSAKPSDAAHPAHPTSGDQTVVYDINQIKVKKADGAGAVTVSELFSKKEELKSKTVTVRGKIIKYNSGILGKNWIHIADGTGSMKDKNNDITVITEGQAKLGDTVLVTGKVVVDKKLDPYFFPVALEEAKIKTN